jgi:hypothetical protein
LESAGSRCARTDDAILITEVRGGSSIKETRWDDGRNSRAQPRIVIASPEALEAGLTLEGGVDEDVVLEAHPEAMASIIILILRSENSVDKRVG